METIRTESLTKHFGKTPVVSDVSLHVNPGEIYGFLGLNGAGKTTLIRMLLGMIKPDQGVITLLGKKLTPSFTSWNSIGYLVETPYHYPNLSVVENLRVYYKLRQLANPALINTIVSKLKLAKYANQKAKTLSLGNQQRLGLAKALMHQPRVLILDEPINGLDPEGIVEVRELLQEFADGGATVFLSSHILGEVSKIAGRIGIIHAGRLLKELPTWELISQLERKVLVKTVDNPKAMEQLAAAHYQPSLNGTGEIEITGPEAVEQPEKITQLLAQAGLPPKQVYLATEDLEMYFLRTIRNSLV